MKLETRQAVEMVRNGMDPAEAIREVGVPRSSLYAALRRLGVALRRYPERPERATVEQVIAWIAQRLILQPSLRCEAAEAYRDFRDFIGDRYLSAMELNKYLALYNLHIVKSNGRKWLLGAGLRDYG